MAGNQYTQINHGVLRDPRLSAKAKGVFAHLSTHDEGWRVSPESIAAHMRDGVDAIKGALRELEQCGYLRRGQFRRPGGTLGLGEWFITDQPELSAGIPPTVATSTNRAAEAQNSSSEPSGEIPPTVATCEDVATNNGNSRSAPLADSPSAEKPPAEKSAHKNNKRKNTKEENLSPRVAAERLVAERLVANECPDATEEEIRALVDQLAADARSSLTGFVRTLARTGDLAGRLDAARANARQVDISGELAAARADLRLRCEHGTDGGLHRRSYDGESPCSLCRAGVIADAS